VVAADGATVRDLAIVGGENGVSVMDVDGVTLDRVTVRGASMHGVEVSDGSVTVTDCVIELDGEYAQGIEVRNSTGRPRSIVRGCRVSGGREGLLTHVARAEFVDNEVSGTSLRGIAVTEMSEGLVANNDVHDVAGAALYCGDMSHCEIRDNVVRDVTAAPGAGRSAEGYGVVDWYFSRIRLAGNRFAGLEAPIRFGSPSAARGRTRSRSRSGRPGGGELCRASGWRRSLWGRSVWCASVSRRCFAVGDVAWPAAAAVRSPPARSPCCWPASWSRVSTWSSTSSR
jgi:hypothetical protein